MNVKTKAAVLVAGLALGATPALANTHGHSGTAGSNAKKYGYICSKAGASKKHIQGQKGTPFSQCVTAMAHLANGSAKNPTAACKGLSKKHHKGMGKGTPFSQCVTAAAHLHKSGTGTTTTGTTNTSTTDTSTGTTSTGTTSTGTTTT